jgi:hypothetical protein
MPITATPTLAAYLAAVSDLRAADTRLTLAVEASLDADLAGLTPESDGIDEARATMETSERVAQDAWRALPRSEQRTARILSNLMR